ncbi:hypothetical protein CASFOL_010733 [Castilleja foliolosa]|uniref:RRM domain-containing protein n=1 Tax=Castilleja foliolosa TaxID=1961234 RepID=A0ABD3DTG4_9LAMI
MLEDRPNREQSMLAEKDGERAVNLGDSGLSETQQQRKRKKEKAMKELSELDTELVEEKSNKSRRDGLRGNELKETLETDTGNGDGESADIIGEKKKKKKRKKMDNAEDTMVAREGFDDESKLLRTVFIGNLPLKLKKKEIVKEFERFGEVDSVRIRSVPIVDGKIPRKGAVIKKQINENGDSVHAYIVSKTEESAQASLAHNMAVVGGNHIRVDRACPPRKKLKGDNDSPLYDNKRTVFVGNLPFDVKDEEIYKLFCGIKNLETSVRVIRDPGSSLGKGIAYVLFKTTDAANLVAKKRNLRLRDRELRLSKSTDTPLKRKSPSQPHRLIIIATTTQLISWLFLQELSIVAISLKARRTCLTRGCVQANLVPRRRFIRRLFFL